MNSSYILGTSSSAELRLGIIDELTGPAFVEAMGALPKRKLRILNLGCGSGHLEARLSTVFSDSSFVGIDISAQRIEEARVRTAVLKSSNSFQFIQDDLTALEVNKLEPCDILITRFVLSHLPKPVERLKHFLPLVKPGGYVCLDEGAVNGSEFYCNTKNPGYHSFVNIACDIQQNQVQKSSFDVGFALLTELMQLPGKILHAQLTQPMLRNARHKSLLRLGIEDGKATFLEHLNSDKVEETITSLRQFEEDEKAYGLHLRLLAIIFQVAE